MSELVQRYTASVFFDKRLWRADIAGSLAHAGMLAQQGIISADDFAAIQRGMAHIRGDIEAGRFEWKLELEDVHLNIEARLTQLVGDAGKRLHTGRSRNDQVATDVRLWLRSEIDLIEGLLKELQRSLVDVAAKNVDVILPGFTHLQTAQPVTFGHHLLAYVEMLDRDHSRLLDCFHRVNVCPLGSGAIAGSTLPLDREFVARLLGFVDARGIPQVTQNSMDAVSDRDFVDIRPDSPTCGQWFGLELSAENGKQLWIPEGLANGFLVTSDSAEFLYKTTDYWYPEHERSLLWNDPDLGIDWPLHRIPGAPILAASAPGISSYA